MTLSRLNGRTARGLAKSGFDSQGSDQIKKPNNEMTYAELFAGIGGWSVGLKPCGWELKWQCECDPFCCAVLRARFGVPIAPDIKQIAGWIGEHPELAQVDAIVGSPPCPPFSVAGKKLGTSDARHLYPAFLESVRLLRPRYVLMEQVAGLLYDRRTFGEYIGGLVEIGYCVLWHSIPACSVGADHARDRIWIVAHASGDLRRTPSRTERQGRIAAPLDGIDADIGGTRLQTPRQCRTTENTAGSLAFLPAPPRFPGREAYPELLRSIHGVLCWLDSNGQINEHEILQSMQNTYGASTLGEWKTRQHVSKTPVLLSGLLWKLDHGQQQGAHKECVTKASAAGIPETAQLPEMWNQPEYPTSSPGPSECSLCGVPLSEMPCQNGDPTKWHMGTWVEKGENMHRVRSGVFELYAFSCQNVQPGMSVGNWSEKRFKEMGRQNRIRALGNAVVPTIPFLIGQAINIIESQ